MAKGLFVLLLTLWTYPTLLAPDFSAEVVETIRGDARPQVKKVYIHGTRMRIIDATPEQKTEGDYMLIDYATLAAYAVMPLQKAYIACQKWLPKPVKLSRDFSIPAIQRTRVPTGCSWPRDNMSL